MKKAVILFTAVVVLSLFPIPSAMARHIGENCRTHSPDSFVARICVNINENDLTFYERIEGFTDWVDLGANSFFIEYDYIRLYRRNLDNSWVIVEAKEANVEFDARWDDNHSTDWYDTCDRPDNRYFYSVARYRVRFVKAGAPDIVTAWNILRSDTMWIDNCQAL